VIIEKDAKISNVVRLRGTGDGPRAVIFAGVHGDEVSGIHAIEKLLFDFFVGSRELRRGSLTLARGNEQAIAAERRYLKLNLNRMYKDEYPADIDRSLYEFKRAQELKSLLHECDYFFDLHSAPTAGEPFVVVEQFAVPFYAKVGIPRLMTGWSKFSSGAIGGDGENYANAHGAKSATLESGSHFDKRSNDVAYKSIVSFLTLLEMIPGPQPQPPAALEVVDVYKVVLKEFEDFRYAGIVDNFKFIGKNQPFAYQNGRPMMVDEDSYLLIPMKPEETKIREEVCYIGRKVEVA
jgi:succinylglutamate desuccinylase